MKKTIEHYFCDCLYFSSNHLSRAITRMAEEAFAPTGLSPSYAFALMVINSHEGITQNELCEILNLTPSTITRFIDKLESKKFARRKCLGKQSVIYPTKQSNALEEIITGCWKKLFERYSKILGEKEGIELSNKISLISKKLEEE